MKNILVLFIFVISLTNSSFCHRNKGKSENNKGNSDTCLLTKDEFKYMFCIQGRNYPGETKMILTGNAYYIKLEEPASYYFKLFDLAQNKGNTYYSQIKCINTKEAIHNQVIEITLQDIINKEGDRIFIFRIKNAYCNLNYAYDDVYFLSEKTGCIVGFYMSTFDNGVEEVINPKGNILKEDIDYSKKKFFRL